MQTTLTDKEFIENKFTQYAKYCINYYIYYPLSFLPNIILDDKHNSFYVTDLDRLSHRTSMTPFLKATNTLNYINKQLNNSFIIDIIKPTKEKPEAKITITLQDNIDPLPIISYIRITKLFEL